MRMYHDWVIASLDLVIDYSRISRSLFLFVKGEMTGRIGSQYGNAVLMGCYLYMPILILCFALSNLRGADVS